MLSKMKVFFQEALAQNGWIRNLRNLVFTTRAFLRHLSRIQTFHPPPGALESVLREVTSASQSLLTPSWAAAQPAATLQCLHQPVKGRWLRPCWGGWEEWEGGFESRGEPSQVTHHRIRLSGRVVQPCWGGGPWANSRNLNTTLTHFLPAVVTPTSTEKDRQRSAHSGLKPQPRRGTTADIGSVVPLY